MGVGTRMGNKLCLAAGAKAAWVDETVQGQPSCVQTPTAKMRACRSLNDRLNPAFDLPRRLMKYL